MLDFITEKISCWDYLKNDKRPVFLYGMGDGALKIMSAFEKYNIPVAGFFASDEFVRNHSFCGHLVHKLSDIENAVDDFIIVLAFAAGYKSLYDYIFSLAQRHTVIVPDVPVAGDGLFTYDYCVENAEKIQQVYDWLEDDASREAYADIINFKISGKIEYLDKCTTEKSEVYTDIIKPSANDVYMDLGAYNGDTIEEFISFSGGCKTIIAVEPDRKNYKKLVKNVEKLDNIIAFNNVIWNSDTDIQFSSKKGRQSSVDNSGELRKAVCVDSISAKTAIPDIIKMDVEGAELMALSGAENTITEYKPKLMISVYHRNEDLFVIPAFIKSLRPDYKLFIRHQLYIPAWETNLYCI